MALPVSYCMDTEYRYRVLDGLIKQEVGNCIRAFSEPKKCEVLELNVRIDHVHLIVSIPPKVSVSDYVGMVKIWRRYRLMFGIKIRRTNK